MGELYTIFYPKCFVLEPYNSNQNPTLIASNNQIMITGETVSVDDKYVNLTWNATDIVNHGYLKYRTQNGFSGVVTHFNYIGGDIITPYSDINTLQFMEIHDVNGAVSQVALGFLGDVLSFSKVCKRGLFSSMTLTGHRWLKWNSIEIKHNGQTTVQGVDYTIDYVQGIIGFPQGSSILEDNEFEITGQYHTSSSYTIDFNNLHQGLHPDSATGVYVSTIDKVTLPISFKKGLAKGTEFSFLLTQMSTTEGDLTNIPATLKKNDIALVEDYKYGKNVDPGQLIKNQEVLGYKSRLVISLGDGDYAKLKSDEFADEVHVFDKGFIDWYIDIVQNATSKGYTDTLIIIPFEHKFLPISYYQKSIDGLNSNRLTPINPGVVEYMKKVMAKIRVLSEGLTNVQFAIEQFGWGVDSRGYYTVHDSYTRALYNTEVGGLVYDSIDMVSHLEVPVTQQLDIAYWLSGKLVSTLATLGNGNYLRVMVDTDLIVVDNFTKTLNNSFTQWKNYIGKFMFVNYNWNGDMVKKHNNLLNKVYDELGLTPVQIGYIISGVDKLNGSSPNTIIWKNAGIVATEMLEEREVSEVMIMSSHAVRRDSYFVYKPMTFLETSGLDRQDLTFDLALCKANRQIIGYLPMVRVTSLQRAVDDVDVIEIEIPYNIPDRITHNMRENPYYYGVADEKLLLLNDKEYYIIKEVSESKGEKTVKKVKAYSLEWKLKKRSVFIQEKLFQLYSEDGVDSDGVLNLLEKSTGWKVQYVDESAKYEVIDGVTTKKYRWFDGINKDWYTFLIEEVATSFNVLFRFNTLNKTIEVYDNNSIGRNQGLYLSEDNYIKSIENSTTSMDIITRLYPVGKEEMSITFGNPYGVPYVDDFSYFIEQNDMSEELIQALVNHETKVNSYFPQWKALNLTQLDKQKQLSIYEGEMIGIDSELTGLNALKKAYIDSGDTTHLAEINNQINAKTIEKDNKHEQILLAQEELDEIDKQLTSITLLLDRETALGNDGQKLFTTAMLGELDEFIYSDTWSNDTFPNVETLLDGGKIELNKRCRPTVTYSLDVVNFLERVYTRRKGWKGELFLRDVIVLNTQENQEVELYLVGFTYSPQTKQLSIELSTKESRKNNAKAIGDILSKANETRKQVEMNRYLWNKNK